MDGSVFLMRVARESSSVNTPEHDGCVKLGIGWVV